MRACRQHNLPRRTHTLSLLHWLCYSPHECAPEFIALTVHTYIKVQVPGIGGGIPLNPADVAAVERTVPIITMGGQWRHTECTYCHHL